MKNWIIIFLLVVSTPALAGTYKCENASGRLVYQQLPCSDTQEAQELVLFADTPSGPGGGLRPGEIALYNKYKQRDRFSRLIQRGKIAVGMSYADVQRSWGQPTKINETISEYGTREQWVYRAEGFETQYVYLKDGKVTAIGN